MKKTRQYVLGLMLVFMMALASGCGDGRDTKSTTEGMKQPQSTAAAQSSAGGMENDTDGKAGNGSGAGSGGAEESTGVLDGLADDVKDGVNDVKDAVEGSTAAAGETAAR